jgi:exonuclease III
MLHNNHPDIVFIMETKLHNLADKFKDKFAATYIIFSIDCTLNGDRGKSGGLILMWDNCTCSVEFINMDFNYIDFIVTNLTNSVQWRATGVYGQPQHQNKHLTCSLIQKLKDFHTNNNWLLFGDFNLIFSNTEKFGGNPLDTNLTALFRNTINICGLQDLGYTGDIFTWNNRQQDNHFIKARLDRYLANTAWINQFPNFHNTHLLRYKSDHTPIMPEFNEHMISMQITHRPRITRFEKAWTRDEQHFKVVKDAWVSSRGDTNQRLRNTLQTLHKWGSNRFGIIPRRIKAL